VVAESQRIQRPAGVIGVTGGQCEVVLISHLHAGDQQQDRERRQDGDANVELSALLNRGCLASVSASANWARWPPDSVPTAWPGGIFSAPMPRQIGD
jgi:hypothetical protein